MHCWTACLRRHDRHRSKKGRRFWPRNHTKASESSIEHAEERNCVCGTTSNPVVAIGLYRFCYFSVCGWAGRRGRKDDRGNLLAPGALVAYLQLL
jgi:hypothetical protein